MNGERPRGWTVLGSGAMAESVRAELERDPDRYTPETWSMEAVGHCPCCDRDVFRCTTRHTDWSEGFATHANVVHPRCNAVTGLVDAKGSMPGCCCSEPNWGPLHERPAKKRKAHKRKARR